MGLCYRLLAPVTASFNSDDLKKYIEDAETPKLKCFNVKEAAVGSETSCPAQLVKDLKNLGCL